LVFNQDGTKVLFDSYSDDLLPPGIDMTNSPQNVYLRDLATGTTTLVSVGADGVHGGNGLSHDGHFVAGNGGVVFDSEADNFGPRDSHRPGDHSGHDDLDLYYRDLRTGATRLVTLNAAGDDSADALSFTMGASSDGTTLGFITLADDFGPTDTPKAPEQEYDAYVARFGGEADLSISLSAAPEPVPPGSSLTYRLDVSNAGPDASRDVAVALLLPEGTTFRSATASAGDCATPTAEQPRLVVCHVGDLDDDGTADVQVTAHVTAASGAHLTALASANATTGDGGNGTNTATADSTVN
jgi:uncharacterized repeat protein (TIGR01451 family)